MLRSGVKARSRINDQVHRELDLSSPRSGDHGWTLKLSFTPRLQPGDHGGCGMKASTVSTVSEELANRSNGYGKGGPSFAPG